MEIMNQIVVVLMLLTVGLAFLSKIFGMLGWKKGAFIASELQKALREVDDEIRGIANGDVNIDTVSEKVASTVSGVTAEEIKPIIEMAVDANPTKGYGVTVDLDKDGKITVNPFNTIFSTPPVLITYPVISSA